MKPKDKRELLVYGILLMVIVWFAIAAAIWDSSAAEEPDSVTVEGGVETYHFTVVGKRR